MEDYLEYLIEKYLIFDKRAELDESNSIDDIYKLGEIENKKLNDMVYIKKTEEILREFNCYDILDFSFNSKKEISQAEEIYMLYKNYKMSVSKLKEIKIDNSINTSNVKYICSLDYCIDMGEKPLEIKSDKKNWNLEYKCVLKYNKKEYKFSVYNWKDNNKWHVGTEIDNKKIIDIFLKELENKKVVDCC
jgi:hypothetical protein